VLVWWLPYREGPDEAGLLKIVRAMDTMYENVMDFHHFVILMNLRCHSFLSQLDLVVKLCLKKTSLIFSDSMNAIIYITAVYV
jgi:hypothetical protein